ncbi:abscisic acid-deficient protein Aba4 family protein [Aestuariivirga litoralis]|uniref:abscisic acid-deficient protein Aba4 family protein n=1 Tax=Aestuariivirga litoralis TaxID=2650924 RepID=UPI0018C4875F|nr:abscisic acid-deficient protein Aba4 family protein [Aestuariivirga litoralis]MBG1232480.1 DUF4281 domain-containing protein [Aestuariivirga litoralis]
MQPAFLFSLANGFALLGWIVLVAGVIFRRDRLITLWAGRVWPITLSAAYAILILFFFFSAPGGFDTLTNVQLLFTAPWAALAGWVHYLAFDLFIGAWIAQQVLALGMTRWVLILILPLTFLFGPIGVLAFFIARLMLVRHA